MVDEIYQFTDEFILLSALYMPRSLNLINLVQRIANKSHDVSIGDTLLFGR